MSQNKTADPSPLSSLALEALADAKAENVELLDVRDKTSITDFMIIASGTSSRHLRTLADRLVERVKNSDFEVLGVEGGDSTEWVLVDLADVIVHLMLPRARAFYNLERLWSAPELVEERRATG